MNEIVKFDNGVFWFDMRDSKQFAMELSKFRGEHPGLRIISMCAISDSYGYHDQYGFVVLTEPKI
jgi:hypothetical protein